MKHFVFDIATAGITARVISSMKIPGQKAPTPKNNRPFITIHLRTAGETANSPVPGPSAIRLNGEDQYDGWIDIKQKTALVTLPSSAELHAPANALRRIFTSACLASGRAVLHSACVARDNKALLFYGKSGAGKTTVCKLSGKFEVISDDMVAVQKQGRNLVAWGLPAIRSGIDGYVTGSHYPVAALFKLVQSKQIYLAPLTPAIAAASILTLPEKQEEISLNNNINVIQTLVEHVPCYELGFTRTGGFWQYIENALCL